MRRRRGKKLIGWSLVGSLFSVVGCAQPAASVNACGEENRPVSEFARPRSCVLLFDRVASDSYSPQDFVWRSGWPSVRDGVSGGEIIWYEERFHDREGWPFTRYNWAYRHFETRRTGVELR